MEMDLAALLVDGRDTERCRVDTTLSVESDLLSTARHENFMIETPLLVSVVDDDESVRESLPDLLKELGFAVRVFPSAEEFLASDGITKTKCLLLDITMPGMSGPELRRELERRGLTMPVIFITARRDESMRSRMLKDGAVECLFKPFSDTALLEALNKAVSDK